MADTPTSRLRLRKPEVGEREDSWGGGDGLNEVIDGLDAAIAGSNTIALSGDYTLTGTNYEANDTRAAVIKFTSSGLTASPTVTFPPREGVWTIINDTGFALTLTCGGQAAIMPIGLTLQLICDATDMRLVRQAIDQLSAPTGAVDLNGQKLTGLADGALATDAATKGQLDAVLNNADVATVAALGSEVATVAGISTQVVSVAADEADIGIVAANISSVNTVADNMADVQNASQVVAGFKPVGFTEVTANTTAEAGKAYRFRANVTLTLPASPDDGDTVWIVDGEVVTDSARPVLNPNGSPIMGLSENINLDVAGFDWLVWFNGSEWRLF